MDLVQILLGYAAGLLTLINPCVLPLLPIIGASALQQSRSTPLFMAAGLVSSTTLLGFLLATVGRSIGLSEDFVSRIGAVFLILFGLVILLPARFSPFQFLSGASASAGNLAMRLQGSRSANFLAGAALGVTWSPCIGPTLGAAIALASTGEALVMPFLIMTAYGLGIGTIFLALAYGGQSLIRRRKDMLQKHAAAMLKLFGLLILIVGIGIFFEIHKYIEIWLIDAMPAWLLELSVKL